MRARQTNQRSASSARLSFCAWVLQHVLPKGFRRARNYGFLQPNSKRLIALLHLLVFRSCAKAPTEKAPTEKAPTVQTERPKLLCRCCGAAVAIVRRRILPVNAPPVRKWPAPDVKFKSSALVPKRVLWWARPKTAQCG